jgi:hypothetical protein
VVTITGGYGKPIRRRSPCETYQYKLEQGEDADVIAKCLTMSIHRSKADRDGSAGFNRPVIYSSIAVAQCGHRGYISTGPNRLPLYP